MGGARGGPLTKGVGGEEDRFVMTFSDVFLHGPFLASPFDLHRQESLESHKDPNLGSAEGGFVPICSDFPVFFRFVPICVPRLRECPDLFRFAPISSDLFRFVFRTNQNKSGKPLSADPFCKSPIESHKEFGLSNLYAGDPFNSLCGYSVCVFFPPWRWGVAA